jgi:hypothetical protein
MRLGSRNGGLLPMARPGSGPGRPAAAATPAVRHGERLAEIIRACWQARGFGDVLTAEGARG